MIGMCGRCYDMGVEIFPTNCTEKPENFAGAPLGMYHCPDCGAMVVAGMLHPELCQICIQRVHPGFDEVTATERLHYNGHEVMRTCREIEVLACRIAAEFSRVSSEPNALVVSVSGQSLQRAAAELKDLIQG